MRRVVDASVAFKWFFADHPDEDHVPHAKALLAQWQRQETELIQPPHFIAEMCAAFAREPSTMAVNLRELLAMRLQLAGDDLVYGRAVALSRELNHHVFDTLYHAVALESPDTWLVTADEAYLRKARRFGRIRHLREGGTDG